MRTESLFSQIGVSGYETATVEYIKEHIRMSTNCTVKTDAVGNLIINRKGTECHRRVLITAHVDEVGFQILRKENEKYRVKCLGNIKTWNAYNQVIENARGDRGIILADDPEALKPFNYEN